MFLKAKEHRDRQWISRSWARGLGQIVPPSPQKESSLWTSCSWTLSPQTVSQQISVVLRHSACGALLKQPQQASPGAEMFNHDSGEASWDPVSKCKQSTAVGNMDHPIHSYLLFRKLVSLSEAPFCSSKKLIFSTFLKGCYERIAHNECLLPTKWKVFCIKQSIREIPFRGQSTQDSLYDRMCTSENFA